jgi:hypothetical protein
MLTARETNDFVHLSLVYAKEQSRRHHTVIFLLKFQKLFSSFSVYFHKTIYV